MWFAVNDNFKISNNVENCTQLLYIKLTVVTRTPRTHAKIFANNIEKYSQRFFQNPCVVLPSMSHITVEQYKIKVLYSNVYFRRYTE